MRRRSIMAKKNIKMSAKKKRKAPAKKLSKLPDCEVLEEIRESYKNRTLIPFIGAGFPRNIDKFPSWNEFVEDLTDELAKNCGCDFGGKNLTEIFPHNIRATEYYVLKIGEKTALEEDPRPSVKNIFKAGKKELSVQLRRKFEEFCSQSAAVRKKWRVYMEFIGLKNFSTLYTTNWDGTLEAISEVALKEDERYQLVFTDKTLRESLATGKQKLLIKYHGHYKSGDSIIAAESDYFHRLMHKNMLDVKLFHDLLHYDFLFIGWSFDDIFIRLTVSQVGDMLSGLSGENLPKMFIVHVGKLHPIMADYFKFNRITAFCICKCFSCPYIDDITKPDDCEKIAKDRDKKCSLKGNFVKFFKKLKEVE
jgi:hypothetical protein